ncbi:MAG: AAA family ATPase, partial [Acidiferrobacterales bacterium]|nr:AAA family ATPase [Acidiferrobacterales bacterium]
MSRRKLPIGIQDFRTIRETDCYYVDKTPHIRQLVEDGRFYFLSRPRRFGKSLLLDTIRLLFEGEEELFRGLAIHSEWNWSESHPVVRLSFGGKYNEPGDVERSVINQLVWVEEQAQLDSLSAAQTGPERLQDVLRRLHHSTGRQVVVLVDEYDKPILDVLDDPEMAKSNRDYLRGLYGIIKDSAEHVRFVLVTGVSMFSKVSLFSGLNNLKDISIDPRFASICGYTDEDLDEVFPAELPSLDRDDIRRWYNGYGWLGGKRLYNPIDILLLFDSRQFRPYWFETGSPQFLFRMLVQERVNPMALENRVADQSLVSRFDVGDIGIDALLFQTGYLTIVGEERRGTRIRYTLDYPNLEVRQSLSHGLLEYVTRRGREAEDRGMELVDLLTENDFAGFGERLHPEIALEHYFRINSPILA